MSRVKVLVTSVILPAVFALSVAQTQASNTVSFSGGQLFNMTYASDGSTGGTVDFNIGSIGSGLGTTGFLNVAADFDSSGGISPSEWVVQNVPMFRDSGLTSQPGLSAWFDPGSATITHSSSYTIYATVEDTQLPDETTWPTWYSNTTAAASGAWGANDPAGQAAAAVPAGNAVAAGTNASTKRTGVPDIAQQTNECGPTSTANSLRWLAMQHGFNTQLPANDDDLIKGLMEAMTGSSARPFGGLNGNQLYDGKKKYIEDNNLPLIVKGGLNDPNASGGKAFDFIRSELNAGEDVEFLIKWPGVGTGSHWVTALGWGINGDRLFLEVNDPDDGKNGAVEWELRRDGTFVNPRGAMLWAVSESVPEPASVCLMALGTVLLVLRRSLRTSSQRAVV